MNYSLLELELIEKISNIPKQQCFDEHRQENENVEIMKPMDKGEVRMSSEDKLFVYIWHLNWLKCYFKNIITLYSVTNIHTLW